jgi:phosphoenolpyruvate carboxylase
LDSFRPPISVDGGKKRGGHAETEFAPELRCARAHSRRSDIVIASRYAELISDSELRDRVFSRLRVEWQTVLAALLRIMG